jgi:hypothetical protein
MALSRYIIDFGQVESNVQDYFMPGIRDQYFLSNAFYYRLQNRVKTYDGGRAIIQPLSFTAEGGGGQWWSGVDKMDTSVRNPITSAVFYRKNFTVPIVLTRDEEDSVNGPEVLYSLVNAKMQIARPTAVDSVGTALFNAGTDPKQVGGLQLVTTTGTITYGNISTTTTSNTWWQPQGDATAYFTGTAGVTPFAASRGFGPIGKMWAKIGRASGKRPTLLVSNWGCYQDYHDSLAGVGGVTNFQSGGQRFVGMDSNLARAGFENVYYKNAPWVVDERAPHSATNIETLWMLHEPAMNLVVHSKRNMSFDGWREPVDQKVRIAYIDWAGEVVCSERRAQGSISNVDTSATS